MWTVRKSSKITRHRESPAQRSRWSRSGQITRGVQIGSEAVEPQEFDYSNFGGLHGDTTGEGIERWIHRNPKEVDRSERVKASNKAMPPFQIYQSRMFFRGSSLAALLV